MVDVDVAVDHESRDNSSDRSWWRRTAEMGWTSALVPEDFGGGAVDLPAPSPVVESALG